MSELPRGWALAEARDLAAPEPGSLTDGPFGSNLKTEHYVSDPGPRVIRLQNIGDGVFRGEDRAFITYARFESLRRHEARSGDVLIAALGETLPRACLVPRHLGQAIVKADCFRLRPAHGVNSRFLQHILNAPQTHRAASTLISGVGRPRLNLGKVGDLQIPVAPTAEQDRIVAAIEKQFSRLDAGVAALERVQARLDRLWQATVDQAFENLAGASNESGSDVFVYVTSGSRGWAKYYSNAGPAFLRVGNVQRSNIRLDVSDVQRVVPPSGAEGRRTLVQSGDVLITITADIGRVAVVPEAFEEAFINQHVAIARPREGICPEYLAWFISGTNGQRQLRGLQRGMTKIGLGLDDIRALQIPLPDSNTQKTIAARLGRVRIVVDDCRVAVAQQIARSITLRSSILAAAFSGMLVPQDPSDEPASLLLERIAAERASSNGQKTTRVRKPRTIRIQVRA